MYIFANNKCACQLYLEQRLTSEQSSVHIPLLQYDLQDVLVLTVSLSQIQPSVGVKPVTSEICTATR